MIEQRGHFEQATEVTERDSTLCFLRWLLLSLEDKTF